MHHGCIHHFAHHFPWYECSPIYTMRPMLLYQAGIWFALWAKMANDLNCAIVNKGLNKKIWPCYNVRWHRVENNLLSGNDKNCCFSGNIKIWVFVCMNTLDFHMKYKNSLFSCPLSLKTTPKHHLSSWHMDNKLKRTYDFMHFFSHPALHHEIFIHSIQKINSRHLTFNEQAYLGIWDLRLKERW